MEMELLNAFGAAVVQVALIFAIVGALAVALVGLAFFMSAFPVLGLLALGLICLIVATWANYTGAI